jgi:hypothetical protein
VVDGFALELAKHRLEGGEIAVDVADQREAHRRRLEGRTAGPT